MKSLSGGRRTNLIARQAMAETGASIDGNPCGERGIFRRRLAVAVPLVGLCLALIIWAAFVRPRDRHEWPPSSGDPSDNSVASYPLGDLSRWLPQVQSLRYRAEVRYESDADAIARHRLELARQYPELKDPDPL